MTSRAKMRIFIAICSAMAATWPVYLAVHYLAH